MKPLMIHADGTTCFHAGIPKAGIHDESGPVCAGGQPVTHASLDGPGKRKVTIREAWQALIDAYPIRKNRGKVPG